MLARAVPEDGSFGKRQCCHVPFIKGAIHPEPGLGAPLAVLDIFLQPAIVVPGKTALLQSNPVWDICILQEGLGKKKMCFSMFYSMAPM